MSDTTCTKCDGRGVIPGLGHVMNGICFRCGGSGFVPASKRPRRSDVIRARNARRWAELEAAAPELAARIAADPHSVPDGFFATLYKTKTPVLELAETIR